MFGTGEEMAKKMGGGGHEMKSVAWLWRPAL